MDENSKSSNSKILIIALTVLIKVVTFPLTKTQLESTNKMQAMQPAIKELQAARVFAATSHQQDADQNEGNYLLRKGPSAQLSGAAVHLMCHVHS